MNTPRTVVTLTQAFRTATVKKGDNFLVEMEIDSVEGYQWHFNSSAETGRLSGAIYRKIPEPGGLKPTRKYKQEVRFEALAAGDMVIEGQKRRTWEDEPPVETIVFNVKVLSR